MDGKYYKRLNTKYGMFFYPIFMTHCIRASFIPYKQFSLRVQNSVMVVCSECFTTQSKLLMSPRKQAFFKTLWERRKMLFSPHNAFNISQMKLKFFHQTYFLCPWINRSGAYSFWTLSFSVSLSAKPLTLALLCVIC